MKSPKEVIDTIRRERFGIGLETDATAQNVIKEQQGMIQRLLETIAEDLYSKQNHFVLELIQNADDNEYSPTVKPLLTFRIHPEKIVVQNNETGFTEPNVRALCDAGKSTKSKALGYIGEKGIGFKSVFRASDRPQIFSNGFCFEFNRDGAQNNFGFIVPHWIDNLPNYVDARHTNIVLPLKREAAGEISKLREIEPTLLLFLKKLKTIEVQDAAGLVNRIERHDADDTVHIQHGDMTTSWKVMRLELKVPGHIHEEKRENVRFTEILLAFPVNSNGSPNTGTKQQLFAYLPTRPYGFKFIIQGDFLVPASREDIHKDKPWNRWIRDNIAAAFMKSVEVFKRDVKLHRKFYNYIPLTTEVTDPFFSPVVTEIHRCLGDAECVLTESNSWKKPEGVYRADSDMRALIPNGDLKRFFNKEYISSQLVASVAVLEELGVAEFGLAELIECLRNSDWLEEQADEWLLRLYAYLGTHQPNKSQLQELKKLGILRLVGNRLSSVTEGSVFFPLDKRGSYGFERELRVLKRPVCENKNKDVKTTVAAFLRRLGVADAKPYEIIETHILPVYKSQDDGVNWKSKRGEVRIGHLRYIKDHLNDYKIQRKQVKGSDEADPLREIKEGLWIRIAPPQRRLLLESRKSVSR